MATNPDASTGICRAWIGGTAARVAVVAVTIVSGVTCQLASAQQWEIEPSLEVVATLTDNLYLMPDGFETNSYVGQVNPGIIIVKEQGRLTTDINYRMQSLFFEDDSDFNNIYHQLDATATLALIADEFFVDFNAGAGQSVVDPTRPIPFNNFAATDNLGEVLFADVNPYYVKRLGGSSAYVRMDYMWGLGRYDGFDDSSFSRVDDFSQNVAGFYLGTNDQETGLDWSTTYDYQFVDYKTITDYKFERAGVGVGIPLVSRLRFIGMGGLESDVVASRDAGGLESEYWEAGFRVTPSQRSALEARIGERFFGTSYFANIEFNGRRFRASATYSENPTTSALDGPGPETGIFSVTGSDSALDDTVPIGNNNLIPVRTEAYISRALIARLELDNGRSRIFLVYADEDREFIEGDSALIGLEDSQRTTTLGLAYELGPRTDLEFNVDWIQGAYAGTDTTTDATQVMIRLSRELGSQTTFWTSYRRTAQDTESLSGFGNYDENAVDIAFVKRF